MIELSKCPTCASEDKVTIAGKEFCMRCGTPSSDSAGTSSSTASQVQPPTLASDTSVAKFSNPPVSIGQPATVDQPVSQVQSTQTPPMPNGASADYAANTQTQPVQNPSNQPVIQDASVNTLTAPANLSTEQTQKTVQSSSQPVGVPAVMAGPSVSNIQNTTYPNQPHPQFVQPSPPGVTPAPELQPQQIPQSAMPHMSAAPEPMQISADQPLTQPIKPTQPEPTQPQIRTHSVAPVMNLDNDTGVFSDEQLEALSDSIKKPTGLAEPKPGDEGQVNTEIKQDTQSVPNQDSASKVIKNNIKISDKNSKAKKILKPAGIGLSIVALFLVGAYIWQVNYPTLAFKIASAKAGMSASMPGYIPGGYKLAGEIQTNPGSVSYSLINGGQNKKISISQTKTDWDSQALAENYVAPKAENYLALQAQGLTVYMLGDSQATWVNKGTWYKIESPDQSLSQDQAIKIATSL